MKLITDQPEIIAQFVATGLQRTFHPPYTALGWVVEHGEQWRLVGGVVFNDYNGYNIEASIYWKGPMTRQPIVETLRYVFEQCKCGRLTAKTARGNAKMRKILPRLGFQIEAELKDFFGAGSQRDRSKNALVFRMERLAAEKWIK